MYIVFMALLALSFHWYFIYQLRKKKQRNLTLIKYVEISFDEIFNRFSSPNGFRQTILHFLSTLEITVALILTLLSFPPFGQLTIHVCPVKLLSDFYPIFHNPTVNYRKKIRCSYEVVYPLYVHLRIPSSSSFRLV